MSLVPAKEGHNGLLNKPQLITNHTRTLEKFERALEKGTWMDMHRDHYDWWMFPIDEKSGRGLTYTLFADDIRDLKQDPEFMTNLRRGMALLLLSWGWDIEKKERVSRPEKGQTWQDYPVRFFKCVKSTLLFDQQDYAESMKQFAILLEREQRLPNNDEEAFRIKKLFALPGTEKRDMPSPRYGRI